MGDNDQQDDVSPPTGAGIPMTKRPNTPDEDTARSTSNPPLNRLPPRPGTISGPRPPFPPGIPAVPAPPPRQVNGPPRPPQTPAVPRQPSSPSFMGVPAP